MIYIFFYEDLSTFRISMLVNPNSFQFDSTFIAGLLLHRDESQ